MTMARANNSVLRCLSGNREQGFLDFGFPSSGGVLENNGMYIDGDAISSTTNYEIWHRSPIDFQSFSNLPTKIKANLRVKNKNKERSDSLSIAHLYQNNVNRRFFSLQSDPYSLVNGAITKFNIFIFENGSTAVNLGSYNVTTDLRDGNWHDVFVLIEYSSRKLTVGIDDATSEYDITTAPYYPTNWIACYGGNNSSLNANKMSSTFAINMKNTYVEVDGVVIRGCKSI